MLVQMKGSFYQSPTAFGGFLEEPKSLAHSQFQTTDLSEDVMPDTRIS
jgi:hypothetical protein